METAHAPFFFHFDALLLRESRGLITPRGIVVRKIYRTSLRDFKFFYSNIFLFLYLSRIKRIWSSLVVYITGSVKF